MNELDKKKKDLKTWIIFIDKWKEVFTLYSDLWYGSITSLTAGSDLYDIIAGLWHGEVDVVPAGGVKLPITLSFLPEQNLKERYKCLQYF